ncbi:PREDICTED: endonuclease V [Nanorana parkeri]|uniref:endonuclease V n=1 Tax=Nanorana parkeri TaxID=125878 RepID=UPI000854E386|nr:PREDICTED: endonuclease V [Nanorana parkeri]
MAEAPSSSEETLLEWERQQTKLKDQLITSDTESWQREAEFDGLERVGGVDLSYIKGNDTVACAMLVVLSYPKMEVIYEDCHMVTLDAPYVAGFLAFREAPSLVKAVETLREKRPDLMPQVLLVDGNGILHHRGFGVACHLGVLTNLPTIGVAKNLLQVDGLENSEAHKKQAKQLENGGDFFHLKGYSGHFLGAALKSCKKSSKPIYVSVGHKISLETAVRLVYSCCNYRVPEPIRQADIRSREFLRKDQEQNQTEHGVEPPAAPVSRTKKKTGATLSASS